MLRCPPATPAVAGALRIGCRALAGASGPSCRDDMAAASGRAAHACPRTPPWPAALASPTPAHRSIFWAVPAVTDSFVTLDCLTPKYGFRVEDSFFLFQIRGKQCGRLACLRW